MDTRTSLALIEVMSPTSQPAGLYSQNKITHFLSLFVMVNTLLQGFYDSLFAQKHGLQLEDNTYALIMQIV
jgi:hypothetical protein